MIVYLTDNSGNILTDDVGNPLTFFVAADLATAFVIMNVG